MADTQKSVKSRSKRRRVDTDTVVTVPQKLVRYHHHSHPHKLFQTIVRSMTIFCDNQNCKRRLFNNEVDYVCFRCNFDLCSRCFTLPADSESTTSLHDSDDEINEDIFFVPDRAPIRAKSVRIVATAEEAAQNAPTIIHVHRNAEEEEEDYDDEDEEVGDEERKENDDAEVNINPRHNRGDTVLTFENGNYDPVTSSMVNQLISNSNNHIVIHENHPE